MPARDYDREILDKLAESIQKDIKLAHSSSDRDRDRLAFRLEAKNVLLRCEMERYNKTGTVAIRTVENILAGFFVKDKTDPTREVSGGKSNTAATSVRLANNKRLHSSQVPKPHAHTIKPATVDYEVKDAQRVSDMGFDSDLERSACNEHGMRVFKGLVRLNDHGRRTAKMQMQDKHQGDDHGRTLSIPRRPVPSPSKLTLNNVISPSVSVKKPDNREAKKMDNDQKEGGRNRTRSCSATDAAQTKDESRSTRGFQLQGQDTCLNPQRQESTRMSQEPDNEEPRARTPDDSGELDNEWQILRTKHWFEPLEENWEEVFH